MTRGAVPCSTVPLPDCGTVGQRGNMATREYPGAAWPPGLPHGLGEPSSAPVPRFVCGGVERWNKPFEAPTGRQAREVR